MLLRLVVCGRRITGGVRNSRVHNVITRLITIVRVIVRHLMAVVGGILDGVVLLMDLRVGLVEALGAAAEVSVIGMMEMRAIARTRV